MKNVLQTPITFLFISINILVYLLVASGVWKFPADDAYFHYFILHSLKLNCTTGDCTSFFQPIQLFTYVFANEEFWGVLLNSWCLYVFGRIIESLIGSKLFGLYFFFCSVLIGAISISLNIEGWLIYRGGGNVLMSLFFATAYLFPDKKMTLLVPIPVSLSSKYWIAIFFFASLAVVLYQLQVSEPAFPILGSFFNFGNMLAMVIAFLFLRFTPQVQRLKAAIEYQESIDRRIDDIGKKEDE